MMFLCLAYGTEAAWKALSKQEQDALLAQDEVLRARGDLVAAVEVETTTVRNPDGTPQISSGPAFTTPLPLAGFGLVEADDLDEAIRLVASTPCARARGAVEIRALHVGPDRRASAPAAMLRGRRQ